MDRSEFKERMARIDSLLSEDKYEDALDILDSVNWRKLHNVNFLLEGADKYERMAKAYESKELLEIAHERSPVGRMIIYRLCILCAKLEELEEAKSYYQKFIELAPNDNIRFIMKYHISKASGADDDTLISILEELRNNELLEEWAYELACLYRKTGQVDKCVTVLDDIILWYGEGPYVEKAFEMKLLYRPLTKDQEIRYRRISTAGSSIVEIHPGERVAKDEFLGKTIRIPEIEESKEKYNTQNLQAEIRKNIEEIMKASEMGEVSDNIDAIKELIVDIPHIQMEEETKTIEKSKYDTKRLDDDLQNKFKKYLSEEFDGQLSLLETGHEENDDQIDGQITIDEVMARWEKTRRAAEQALLESKERQLKKYKKEAWEKANSILDMLIASEGGTPPKREPVFTELDEITSIEEESKEEEPLIEEESTEDSTLTNEDSKKEEPLIKEESTEDSTLSNEESEEENTSIREESNEEDISTTEESEEEETMIEDESNEEDISIEEEIDKNIPIDEDTSDSDGSHDEKDELKEQKTFSIPKIAAVGELSGEGFEIPIYSADDVAKINSQISESEKDKSDETDLPSWDKNESEAEKALKDINNMLQSEIDKLTGLDNDSSADEISNKSKDDTEPEVSEEKSLDKTTTNLPVIDIGDIETKSTQNELSLREKEILSYFAAIPGMEVPLIKMLSGVRENMVLDGPKEKGHMVITGMTGSGKTRLAQNIIKIMQEETGKPRGNIGRIDGLKLNEKDIRVLFEKIRGGALIIENASKLNKETIVSLTLYMETDKSGTLVVLEDEKSSISGILKEDIRFSKKFSERINIPVMMIDELVNFGKIYAAENGYGIDEMGILALYDRINVSGRPEGPASVVDVKDIMDKALNQAQNRKFKGLFGLFSNKSGDDNGVPTLQEKDFQE